MNAKRTKRTARSKRTDLYLAAMARIASGRDARVRAAFSEDFRRERAGGQA